jgi:hypothetical protein
MILLPPSSGLKGKAGKQEDRANPAAACFIASVFFILKLEAIYSSEASLHFCQPVQHHNPRSTLHNCCHENLETRYIHCFDNANINALLTQFDLQYALLEISLYHTGEQVHLWGWTRCSALPLFGTIECWYCLVFSAKTASKSCICLAPQFLR